MLIQCKRKKICSFNVLGGLRRDDKSINLVVETTSDKHG